jgi:hypothetical protein
VEETEVRRMARQRAIELRRSIGVALRRLREDAGLTLAAVARGAGIHASYLRLIEKASARRAIGSRPRLPSCSART